MWPGSRRLSLCAVCVAALLPVASAARDAESILQEAQRLLEAGDLDPAIGLLRSLAEQASDSQSPLSDPSTAAMAWNNVCVLESDRGRYRDALPPCERTVELRRRENDDAGLARALNNLGRALLGLGRLAEAHDRFLDALRLNDERRDVEGQVINLSNLGIVADRRARFGESLRRYQEALERIESSPGEEWAPWHRRLVELNRAALLERIGGHEEALETYLRLLATMAPDDLQEQAALQANLGVTYRNLGDAEQALKHLERAAELATELGDVAALANARLNQGLVLHLNLARPEQAERSFELALRLARDAGDRAEEMQAAYYHGKVLLELGDLARAAASFADCARLAAEIGSAEGRWSAEEGQGRVALARGDTETAGRLFLGALEIVESVGHGISGAPAKAGFFGSQRAVYDGAVETLVRLHRQQPAAGWQVRALEVARQAKARDLTEALAEGRASTPPGAGPEEHHRHTRPFVELYLGAASWFAWRSEADTVTLHGSGPVAPLLDRVHEVYRALASGSPPRPELLASLSSDLLGGGPVPQELDVAPDGALWRLPFEILPVAGQDGRQARLVELSAISYRHTAATPRPQPDGSRDRWSLLGFAPWSRGVEGQPPLPLGGRRLEALPASHRELETAARSLGGHHLLLEGGEASDARLLISAARPGARVLHVASHTVLHEGRSDAVAIVMAPADGGDGLLVPSELASAGLRVDLTVLAACTTLGTAAGGRALSTLSGALLAGGSGAVLATLWDVDDATSLAFFEQFYYDLGRGLAPAAALAATKRRLRADPSWRQAEPWAAFVLIGDSGPVVRPPPRRLLPAALALLLSVPLLWILWRRRRITARR